MRIDPPNTDAQDSARLNTLRSNARVDLIAAIDHALRCGALTFERANRIAAIIKER